MSSPAVEVQQLSKRFRLYRQRNQSLKSTFVRRRRATYDELWALREVSLHVPAGSAFALVGDNGSGKSTLLKCLARILVPDEGSVAVSGRVAALLELGSGFHAELTGRENVFLNGTILGMTRREVASRFDAIVGFAGLEHAIDQPLKSYSSGMSARLGFAVATSVEPDILLVDEVLAVGDAAFQRRCMDRIQEFTRAGRTVILVSHAAAMVRLLCSEAAWLRDGQLVEVGEVDGVLDRYERASVEDRREVAGDDRRWGTGNVVVTKVALLVNGSETSTVATGERVDVAVSWSVRDPVPELVVGLGVLASDGTHLWGANTGLARLQLDGSQQQGHVVLEIPRLALQPGRFEIDVSAHNATGAHTYDYHRGILSFNVVPGDARESGGYVSLGGSWRPGRPDSDADPADR